MRFTEQFNVAHRLSSDDWFDLETIEDTPLYVDPFLVFEDDDPFWSACHQDLVDFFSLALRFVRLSEGDRKSPHWRKAQQMLTFPEPKEFAFGLSMGHPEGSGTADDFADRMADALDLLRRDRVDTLRYVEAFVLFCKGLGVDRISDMFCNITKGRFISYTQQVVDRHGLPTESVLVRHRSWSRKSGRWDDGRVALPRSPAFNGGVLLCPDRFLKDIPRVTADGFWSWAETNEASMLRFDLNYDLSQSLTKAEKTAAGREVARARPNLALAYVDKVADEDHLPYNVLTDPQLLVGWAEAGRDAAQGRPRLMTPESADDFYSWVGVLMNGFKHAVEQTDLWKTLWNDDYTRPRQEKIVQAIASMMWQTQCQAAGVDLSREVNIGRGPVDFKFSAGWHRRALTEVKLIKSSGFFTGASKQLPQYLESEQIEFGYYLCVGFTDLDFGDERLGRVRDTCSAIAEKKGVTMTPVFVDARVNNKTSASKQTESDDDE
ncbi:hypothetical protein AB0E69_07555 [Kribbella sp. NPDC026611]|uniref:hypothetical protein n=1 Tax=Kribbella sp. NPDC026611 TaxID=3154911 RepID=UPI0033D8BC76